MTKRKIIFFSISLIVVLLAVSAFLFIRSSYFLDTFIKDRLEQALQDQISDKYTVHIDKLSGNVFTGIEVADFTIKESDETPMLSTENIILKYNFFGLLRRKFLVTALEINAPEINLRRNSDGQTNLTQVFRKTTQDSDDTFAFTVSKATIEGGKIHFVDTQQNIELELPNIALELNGPLDNWDHKGTLSFNQGSFMLNGTELPIAPLKKIPFSVSTTGGDLQEHKLKLGDSILTLRGNWGGDVWDANAELRLGAADVQKFLSDDTQLEGAGVITLNLKGTDSTLNGTLTGTSEALSIKQKYGVSTESKIRQIDLTDLTVNTTLALEETPKVTLNDFSVQVADGTLSGSGNATFDNAFDGNIIERLQHYVKQSVIYDSNWEIADIQIRSILSMFVDLPAQGPQIESGIFTGSLQISGDTTGNFHLDSSVKLSETNLLVEGDTTPIALKDSTLNGKIVLAAGNDSNISADGVIDGTNVGISGSFEDIDVQLKNIDFGKLFKIFNSLPVKGIGNITAQIKTDGTATGYAEIPETFFCHNEDDPIPLGRLAGNFRYTDKTVYFENAHLIKNGDNGDTNVSIKGNIKIEGDLPANFSIVAEPLVLDKNYNKLFFTQEYPIEANIKGELKLYGQLIDRLDGSGRFTIDSGKAWNINLDTATFPLKIDDYTLTISDFLITTRGQQVILNTRVEDNGDFVFSLKNSKDKPIQLAELALAADIADFPLDGKMDVNVVAHQKKPQDLVFYTDLNFSDLTFEGNPLGDAYLRGTLIEQKKSTGEPDYFQFTGNALAGTGSIEGIINNATDNPYKFTLTNEKTAVSPLLRIFDPTLETITGTADGTVIVEGTIAELAPTEVVEPSKKRVYPYDVDILISETQLQYNSLRFTNPKPIRLNLKDDILTISDSSLTVSGEQTSFVQLTGTFNAKSETMNISAASSENFALDSLGMAFGLPISGTVYCELQTNGTLSDPIVDLKWKVPKLVVNTKMGDISVRDANGEVKYQDNTVHIKPFSMLVLDNVLQVGGKIAVNQDEFNNSQLNLGISGDNFDLAKLSDLVRNSIPADTVKHLTFDNSVLLEGNVGILLNVVGSIAEPIIDLNARTTADQPIHFGAFAKPITLTKLQAMATVSKQSVQIKDLIVNGQIGTSNFQIDGNTTFSTQNKDETMFDLGVSVEKLEVGDFITFFQQQTSPLSGTVSGTVKLLGTGFSSDHLAATCEINALNLQAYNNQISNISPINFKLKNSRIISQLPLQVSSPAMETKFNTSLEGPLSAPIISVIWDGTLNYFGRKETDIPLQWQGKAEYVNKEVNLGIQLTNNGNNLTLNGLIPLDLTLSEIDLSERFIDAPINVQLIGKELPLTFFPRVDVVFAEVAGVTDIDLTIQGTTRSPYLQGHVFLESPKIRFNNFNQPFEKVRVQLNAHKDRIEFERFQFNIEGGTCDLQKSELELDGLTPKSFIVENLTLKQYPLGSILRQSIPQDTFTEVGGQVTATLTKLSIPFENFFANGERSPIPKIREKITFERLSQKAEADCTIDDISIGFAALNQQYNFKNPEPIPISLNSGTFLVKELKLKNTAPIVPNVPENPLIFTCFGRWNMQGDMFAYLKLDNFNITVIDQLLPNEFRDAYELKGVLSTEINIRGAYAAPEITVKCNGDKLAINRANVDKFSAELHYDHADQQWEIPDGTELLRLGNNRILCSGNVPYLLSFSEGRAEPLAEEMAVKIDFELEELGLLPLIQPLVQSAGGVGTIETTITGTPKTPRLTGIGKFNGINLKLAQSPIYFENMNAQFNISELKVGIETITGQLNGGNFSATGEITTDWLKPTYIDLKTNLENCIFVEPGQYKANVSSGSNDLRLYGNIEKPAQTELILTGDIILHSGYYKQNWENIRDWFSGSTVSELEVALGTSFLRNLQLDVGIEIPENFHFLSSLGLSSLGGTTDVEITCRRGRLIGPIQEPIFAGTLSIPSGRISIVTQIFEIDESSTITNLSDTDFNPVLDISLQLPNPIRGVLLSDGSTTDVVVSATVTGTLEDNKLSLIADSLNSTTPEVFSDADVLALLSPGNSISRSFGKFTISSVLDPTVLDPNEWHIIAEYPLPFGKNMSIKGERDENGEFGVDLQLLEQRF